MVSAERPHYLLFSTAEGLERCGNPKLPGGRWRFQLQSADGLTTFSAADDEPELDRRRLELLAAVRGLEAIDRPALVTLLTPCRYVTRGIRFGIGSWRESNWRWENFGRMSAVRNADLWQRIDAATRIHQVRCHAWVAAAAATNLPDLDRTKPRTELRLFEQLQFRWQQLRDQLASPRSALCPQ